MESFFILIMFLASILFFGSLIYMLGYTEALERIQGQLKENSRFRNKE